MLFKILEIIGLFAFAIAGVLVGIEYKLDVFGIYVVSICCSMGGGIVRDLVLGITPPVPFTDPVPIVVTMISATLSLVLFKAFDTKLRLHDIKVMKTYIMVFDAFGLGVFTAVGCSAAVTTGYAGNLWLVIFVGTITAVGGGIMRDLLAGRRPVVMRKEIYAVAAIIGTLLFYVLNRFVSLNMASVITPFVVTAIRLLAMWRHLNMPYSIKNEDLMEDD